MVTKENICFPDRWPLWTLHWQMDNNSHITDALKRSFSNLRARSENAIWPCYWNISLQGYKMRKCSFSGRHRRKIIIFAGVRFPKEDVSRHINKVRIFGGKWPFRKLKRNFQFFSLHQNFLLSTQRVIRNIFRVWMYVCQPPK